MAFNGEIYEIMSWLPVKPLYKLITMAKSSFDYISETFFQEKQCYNSCMRDEESLIIQEDSSLKERVQNLQFCFLPYNQSYNGIPKDSIEFLSEKGRILATCNGLVLGRTISSSSNDPTELFLCNPSTRTWLPIKLPDEELANRVQSNEGLKVALVCGNAYSTKKFPLDYTIILFNEHNLEEWNCGYDVYVYEEDKWSLIDENIKTGGGGMLCFDNQVCCKDGLYVLSEGCLPVIFHYDIKNRKPRVIALPENFQKCENNSSYFGCFRVFGWERNKGQSWFDSICLVKCSGDSLITIWVLQHETKSTTSSKEVKNSSSWNWVSTLHIEDELGIVDSRWTQSFTILDKHLIYADCDGNIYRYCLDDGNYNKIYEYGQCASLKIRFNSFSTTLRPCSKDAQQIF